MIPAADHRASEWQRVSKLFREACHEQCSVSTAEEQRGTTSNRCLSAALPVAPRTTGKVRNNDLTAIATISHPQS